MRTPLRPSPRLLAIALLACAPALTAADSAATAPQSPLAWPEVKQEHKPWTRWWWMGSAVDKENLTRELTEFAAAGLGGVEITPIYGAKGYEDRFIDFLSPKYVEMLGHTAAEGKRLGIAIDMATGTGWPFGGSFTPKEDAELKIEIVDGKLTPRSTGFKVKRAAPGAAGLVLDPYSPDAIARYLAHFDKALAPLPPGAIHGHFHDSFEYTANWTPALTEKFKAMHGYDLAAHMAELEGKGDPDTIARIKSDYREVLAQLHMDYMHTWGDWVRKNGGVVRNQGHGAPANLLDLYALADIPETEVFGATNFPIPFYRFTPGEISYNETQPLINRFASSAAHVTGKPLISSETFTWAREHFHEAPSELKPELDQLFLTGINHVFYHGTAFSPADAPWPGWLFYASTQYNNRNPLWRDLAEGLNAYITRAQSLLQSGQPDADVLVYWPFHDLLHKADGWERKFSMHGKDWLTDSSTGKLAQQLIEAGIQFDFISDAQICDPKKRAGLSQSSRVEIDRPILVPQSSLMPLETLQKLHELGQKGNLVCFIDDLPTDVPGFAKLSERRTAFQKERAEILGKLKDYGGVRMAFAKKHENIGGAILVGDFTQALSKLPKGEPLVDAGLGFIRRISDDQRTKLYFVTNLSGKPFDGTIGFKLDSRPAGTVVFLEPRTGKTGTVESRVTQSTAKGRTSNVRLQLAPGESLFVRIHSEKVSASKAWAFTDNAAQTIPLAGDWRVTFLRGGPELPPDFSLSNTKLASWTEQSPAHEGFAGTARYELDFALPATPAGAGGDWLLDLGDVRETARVFVNGTQVDLLWSLPFRTRIDASHLKPGRNTLAIEVTNLASNRIRDLDKRGIKWANFYDSNIVNVNYKKMDASSWPIMPAGLLGPITLTPLK
ncbi:glycosyl hydrolase [Nibricoccus aquaticus]|nr:glycosyl hydrolase [Nibricoccus aquaticus]